jgi:hypothetical protein
MTIALSGTASSSHLRHPDTACTDQLASMADALGGFSFVFGLFGLAFPPAAGLSLAFAGASLLSAVAARNHFC